MNNRFALHGSIVMLTVTGSFFILKPAHALSPGSAPRPVLQDTVLTSPATTTVIPDKIIKVAHGSPARRIIAGLTSRLKKRRYSDIYFTKTGGAILEAEACKNDSRYFLQIASDGEILQSTRFDSCTRPQTRSSDGSGSGQDGANPNAQGDVWIPAVQAQQAGEGMPISPGTRKRKTLVLYPGRNSPGSIRNARSRSRIQMLKLHGYGHIYVPQNRMLGVMACKGGTEYSFGVLNDAVYSWKYMQARRKPMGKCFGYGKQILNKRDLLTILRRHGDRKIRVVRGKLPMFEAYTCLNGQRRHIKVNRWGNDNVRNIGKCS